MAKAPSDLKELYTADLRDLWSANHQMQQIVQSFSEKAQNDQLKLLFKKSVSGINEHTGKFRQLVKASKLVQARGSRGWWQKRPGMHGVRPGTRVGTTTASGRPGCKRGMSSGLRTLPDPAVRWVRRRCLGG